MHVFLQRRAWKGVLGDMEELGGDGPELGALQEDGQAFGPVVAREPAPGRLQMRNQLVARRRAGPQRLLGRPVQARAYAEERIEQATPWPQHIPQPLHLVHRAESTKPGWSQREQEG